MDKTAWCCRGNNTAILVSDTESTASLRKRRAIDGGEVRNYRDATTATASGHISVASPSVSGPSSSVQDQAARQVLQDPILHLSHPEAPQLVRAATPTTLPTRKPHETEYMRHEGVFTKFPDDVCDELIGCYFQHVHFFLPILDVPTVLNEYWSRGSQGINPLLLWSMFLASANFIGGETLEKAGFSSRKAMKTTMYYRAKCLYHLDLETSILDRIRSVMLLAFWHSDPQDYTGAWYWIGIAISLAQAINLHRDAAKAERKRLVKVSEPIARRIWWSLVVGDRWIAAANGRPMRLRDDSHDLARPTREDVLWELKRVNPEARSEFILENESSLAALWLRMVRVSDALGDVLQLHHRVKGPEPSMEKVNRLLYELDEVEFAYSPSSDDDDVHVHTVQVEMLYQATIAILCRPYVLDATKSSAADANPKLKQSFIRRGREAASSTNDLVEQLIEMNAIEYMKPMIITAMVPATQIHLADCKSESTLTRRHGRSKLQLCVSVFAELRPTYWSADVMHRLFKRAQDLAAGEMLVQPSPRENPRRPETPGERQRAEQRMRNVHLMASTLVSAAAAAASAALPPIVPMTPVSTGTVSQFGDMDQLLSPEFALSDHMFMGLLPNHPIGNYI
ncbi:C6 transcription factor [Beauveria brongniartii RCEF 3172]|uniref:C6 transcription factor n=1 Tax=Beauveria brongniartii RCEF 3172 TaxID=1081107 RepID=A0A162JFF5_9HYPO|nr:C6 transcription factor [Beauveria brongniartii RCEF 3172]